MNNIDHQPASQDKSWFYEKNGQRIGGISENDIAELVNKKTISYGTPVWKSGFSEWIKIENTELRHHLEKIVPPPLLGEHVNNSVVWILAFAPIIGLLLEFFVSGAVHGDNYLAEEAAKNGDFWYVTLILNIALSLWDAKRLKRMGTDTSKFSGWAWLVPAYLFQRATALQQSKAYFITWIACFVLSIAATE